VLTGQQTSRATAVTLGAAEIEISDTEILWNPADSADSRLCVSWQDGEAMVV
jgi:hypothetical protein